MRVSIKTGFGNLRNKIARIQADVQGASVEGVRDAMVALRDDAFNECPKVPYRTGFLKSRHFIRIVPLMIGVVGYLETHGVRYATVIHEGISRWGTPFHYHTPGTGAKWIEAKMLRHYKKYIGIVARKIHESCRKHH
ncbi:MAG: hypothetical protein J7J52_04620 [Deltaproteobacteria bacterium]|nr:hypothetical protein [Deltaproteobacteria bacterium]